MRVRDEAIWAKWRKNNEGEPYGAAIMRFAEQWADLMESRLDATASNLRAIAQECCTEVDARPGFGITGFMYSAAVSVLASCWVHGEALRRWHNSANQINGEGDRANARGGVLNTAVLSVETSK